QNDTLVEPRRHAHVSVLERPPQAVQHRQEGADQVSVGLLQEFFLLALRAFAEVLELRLFPQQPIGELLLFGQKLLKTGSEFWREGRFSRGRRFAGTGLSLGMPAWTLALDQALVAAGFGLVF